jgi:uncharacterized membrane protein
MGPIVMIFVLGCVFVVVALPLVFEKVPPNCYYGFRTRKTLADRTVWYKANKFMGVGMILASLVSMGFAAGALLTGVFSPDTFRIFAGLILVVPVGVVLIASALYLRSL